MGLGGALPFRSLRGIKQGMLHKSILRAKAQTAISYAPFNRSSLRDVVVTLPSGPKCTLKNARLVAALLAAGAIGGAGVGGEHLAVG